MQNEYSYAASHNSINHNTDALRQMIHLDISGSVSEENNCNIREAAMQALYAMGIYE